MTNQSVVGFDKVEEEGLKRRNSERIAGIGVVAWTLATTRWGSYIGSAPIFVTDCLILAASAHLIVTRAFGQYSDEPKIQAQAKQVHPLLWLLLLCGVIRLLFSPGYNLTALRDAVPYFYVVMGILAATAIRRATQARLDRTKQLLLAALSVHAAWFFVVTVLAPGLPNKLPMVSATQGLHLLAPRNDVDTALVGVFAAYLLMERIKASKLAFGSFIMLIGCWVAIVSTGSRAGLLGAVSATLIVIASSIASGAVRSSRRLIIALLVPFIAFGALVYIPHTTIGQRLSGTFGVESNQSAAGAEGTARARQDSWATLITYVADDPARFATGVGFGPNFMQDSGAGISLDASFDGGDTSPRSPHNYWLGTLAREGLVGLALFAWLLLLIVRSVLKHLRVLPHDSFVLLLCLLPTSLVVPLTFGVVMESPFGAIPFFWAAGALLSYVGCANVPVKEAVSFADSSVLVTHGRS